MYFVLLCLHQRNSIQVMAAQLNIIFLLALDLLSFFLLFRSVKVNKAPFAAT